MEFFVTPILELSETIANVMNEIHNDNELKKNMIDNESIM
jgi:hypothetical protein